MNQNVSLVFVRNAVKIRFKLDVIFKKFVYSKPVSARSCQFCEKQLIFLCRLKERNRDWDKARTNQKYKWERKLRFQR